MSFPLFTMLSLQNALGVPSSKLPIDITTLVSYILPPLFCHFVTAVLAIKPQTRTVRIALWPLVALLALRAALSVDMSLGKPEYKFNTTNFVLLMIYISVRSLKWTLAEGPFVRHLRPAKSAPSTIMDALDLTCNFRGLGWSWSGYRSYLPPETRPTNRTTFVFYVLFSAIAHAIVCGIFQRAVLTLIPMGVGSIQNAPTIFDDTLPFPTRYLRSSLISIFTVIVVYSAMQLTYDLCTIPAVVLLGQDPAQWPPAFDAPWRATSLSDFWGRRWHQFLRHTFIVGGYPLSFVFGRPGAVIGTFIASSLWHQVTPIMLSPQVETWWMSVGFGVMGPGVLAEQAFHQLTGRRVGGIPGWIWTMTWILVWGHMIVEGFARGGMFSNSSPLDNEPLLRPLVERSMMRFEAWLHHST